MLFQTRLTLACAALAVVILTISGCGGDSTPSTSAPPPTPPAPPTSPPTPRGEITAETPRNTLQNKIPLVDLSTPKAAGGSNTEGLTDEQQADFEYRLGRAMASTGAARWAAFDLLKRVEKFVLKCPSPWEDVTLDDEKLHRAFSIGERQANHYKMTPREFQITFTGSVGPSLAAIKEVLAAGPTVNMREALTLIATFQKAWGSSGEYFDDVVNSLAAAGNITKLTECGLDADSVMQRYHEMNQTKTLYPDPANSLKYSNGIINYLWPSYDSWVRFTYDAPNSPAAHPSDVDGPLVCNGDCNWATCRPSHPGDCAAEGLPDDCRQTSLRSDTDSNNPASPLWPPLSEREIAFECGGLNGTGRPPCRLQWSPGKLAVGEIVDVPFGIGVPGFLARSRAMEYRALTGPSGTANRFFFLAQHLGFDVSGAEGAMLRMAMLGWMLPADDHSFWEVLLGTEPFLSNSSFAMVLGRDDLGRVSPNGAALRTKGGQAFDGHEAWAIFETQLKSDESGRQLFDALTPQTKEYLDTLFRGTHAVMV